MSDTNSYAGERRGRTTLAQVAERAGVSTVAVSTVLNRSRTATRVSSATRARIMEVAAELHYTPNAVARSLRRSRTDVIAFCNAQDVNFRPTYPFYAAILSGIQEGCALHKKDLLIHANFAQRSDDDIFLDLHNGQIDGLVLYARSVTPLVERLVKSQLPIVTVAEPLPGVPYIGIDEAQGGQLLARHVAQRGYRRVIYRGLREENTPLSQKQRKRTFIAEAHRLGLEVHEISQDPWLNSPTPAEEQLLHNLTEPTVVACWGDVSADGLVAYCLTHGLSVPQDVAIVGFDGFPATRRPSMQLTTISAPWSQVARKAVELLVAQCEGEAVPEQTILPVELLVGDTT